ncbi:putative deoxyribonuclease TATDN1 [Vitis vinifera]|uniref:Putative deoxyribonuclease TATDN1 n=1 Tax=Vitis vinifera TaxID=29760 RepID=A0A438GKC4_VITVI|nr:putative deoxyribonuclease TATDN1 [Vitis vinifera]
MPMRREPLENGDRGEVWSRGCGWRTKEVCGPYGVGLWKEIMKEADWCWESIVFKVRKGTKVLFWTDKWCGNEALSQIFPQLFTLAGHRNAKVSEVWDSSLGQGGWNLRLARDFNDWELDQIGNMLNLLRDFRTSTEEDAVRWKREGNGVFGAKGAYKMLFGSSACAFPNRRIWMDKVPTKVSFFAWEASWGKILTLDKLQRRGWQLPNWCFLCGCEEENANHILLHCTVVKTLWEIALVIFGVQWVFPESVIEVLLSWRGVNGCSLKTAENLEVVRGIPVERLMIETDSPYCEIKNTHAGINFVKSLWPSKKKEKYEQECIVKGRNEPCLVRDLTCMVYSRLSDLSSQYWQLVSSRQVLEVVAGCKGVSDIEQLSKTLYHNTCRVFFPQDLDSAADALLAGSHGTK